MSVSLTFENLLLTRRQGKLSKSDLNQRKWSRPFDWSKAFCSWLSCNRLACHLNGWRKYPLCYVPLFPPLCNVIFCICPSLPYIFLHVFGLINAIYNYTCSSTWEVIERPHRKICNWRWSFPGTLLISGFILKLIKKQITPFPGSSSIKCIYVWPQDIM